MFNSGYFFEFHSEIVVWINIFHLFFGLVDVLILVVQDFILYIQTHKRLIKSLSFDHKHTTVLKSVYGIDIDCKKRGNTEMLYFITSHLALYV